MPSPHAEHLRVVHHQADDGSPQRTLLATRENQLVQCIGSQVLQCSQSRAPLRLDGQGRAHVPHQAREGTQVDRCAPRALQNPAQHGAQHNQASHLRLHKGLVRHRCRQLHVVQPTQAVRTVWFSCNHREDHAGPPADVKVRRVAHCQVKHRLHHFGTALARVIAQRVQCLQLHLVRSVAQHKAHLACPKHLGRPPDHLGCPGHLRLSGGPLLRGLQRCQRSVHTVVRVADQRKGQSPRKRRRRLVAGHAQNGLLHLGRQDVLVVKLDQRRDLEEDPVLGVGGHVRSSDAGGQRGHQAGDFRPGHNRDESPRTHGPSHVDGELCAPAQEGHKQCVELVGRLLQRGRNEVRQDDQRRVQPRVEHPWARLALQRTRPGLHLIAQKGLERRELGKERHGVHPDGRERAPVRVAPDRPCQQRRVGQRAYVPDRPERRRKALDDCLQRPGERKGNGPRKDRLAKDDTQDVPRVDHRLDLHVARALAKRALHHVQQALDSTPEERADRAAKLGPEERNKHVRQPGRAARDRRFGLGLRNHDHSVVHPLAGEPGQLGLPVLRQQRLRDDLQPSRNRVHGTPVADARHDRAKDRSGLARVGLAQQTRVGCQRSRQAQRSRGFLHGAPHGDHDGLVFPRRNGRLDHIFRVQRRLHDARLGIDPRSLGRVGSHNGDNDLDDPDADGAGPAENGRPRITRASLLLDPLAQVGPDGPEHLGQHGQRALERRLRDRRFPRPVQNNLDPRVHLVHKGCQNTKRAAVARENALPGQREDDAAVEKGQQERAGRGLAERGRRETGPGPGPHVHKQRPVGVCKLRHLVDVGRNGVQHDGNSVAVPPVLVGDSGQERFQDLRRADSREEAREERSHGRDHGVCARDRRGLDVLDLVDVHGYPAHDGLFGLVGLVGHKPDRHERVQDLDGQEPAEVGRAREKPGRDLAQQALQKTQMELDGRNHVGGQLGGDALWRGSAGLGAGVGGVRGQLADRACQGRRVADKHVLERSCDFGHKLERARAAHQREGRQDKLVLELGGVGRALGDRAHKLKGLENDGIRSMNKARAEHVEREDARLGVDGVLKRNQAHLARNRRDDQRDQWDIRGRGQDGRGGTKTGPEPAQRARVGLEERDQDLGRDAFDKVRRPGRQRLEERDLPDRRVGARLCQRDKGCCHPCDHAMGMDACQQLVWDVGVAGQQLVASDVREEELERLGLALLVPVHAQDLLDQVGEKVCVLCAPLGVGCALGGQDREDGGKHGADLALDRVEGVGKVGKHDGQNGAERVCRERGHDVRMSRCQVEGREKDVKGRERDVGDASLERALDDLERVGDDAVKENASLGPSGCDQRRGRDGGEKACQERGPGLERPFGKRKSGQRGRGGERGPGEGELCLWVCLGIERWPESRDDGARDGVVGNGSGEDSGQDLCGDAVDVVGQVWGVERVERDGSQVSKDRRPERGGGGHERRGEDAERVEEDGGELRVEPSIDVVVARERRENGRDTRSEGKQSVVSELEEEGREIVGFV